MKIKTVTGSVTEARCDVLVVNLFEGVTHPGGATGAVDEALGGALSQQIRDEGFEGKLGQVMSVRPDGKIPARCVIVVGLGKQEKFDQTAVRKASAAACRRARDIKSKTVVSIVHGTGIGGLAVARSAQSTVEGAIIGTYSYQSYKSEKDNHRIDKFTLMEVVPEKAVPVSHGAARGEVVGKAVNQARDLINAPANEVTPSYLADFARGLASESIEVTVLEKQDAEKLGMGAFTAVARGSAEPPKFIVMRYRPGKKSRKTIAIIGKGVTFDSGGLSIKTADQMITMKDDMSGSAAVLSVMQALPALKPEVNVLGIVAATENMPGGSAYKPGDVVRAMNGKTIEIENTDAEGRVTLADALCYAVDQGADEILDLATLTGACVVALGRGLSGVFCNDQEMLHLLGEQARVSGDLIWAMPLFEDYFEQIKSDVADMKNTGGREAGAVTAALLLKEFVDGRPWAHIDIAGPAFLQKDNGLVDKGGAGAGVRLLIEHLCGPPQQ